MQLVTPMPASRTRRAATATCHLHTHVESTTQLSLLTPYVHSHNTTTTWPSHMHMKLYPVAVASLAHTCTIPILLSPNPHMHRTSLPPSPWCKPMPMLNHQLWFRYMHHDDLSHQQVVVSFPSVTSTNPDFLPLQQGNKSNFFPSHLWCQI